MDRKHDRDWQILLERWKSSGPNLRNSRLPGSAGFGQKGIRSVVNGPTGIDLVPHGNERWWKKRTKETAAVAADNT